MWYSVDLQLRERVDVPVSELKEHKDDKFSDLPLFDNMISCMLWCRCSLLSPVISACCSCAAQQWIAVARGCP